MRVVLVSWLLLASTPFSLERLAIASPERDRPEAPAPAKGSPQATDTVLRALQDELARSVSKLYAKKLSASRPYFVGYTLKDGTAFTARATFGCLTGSNVRRTRTLRTEIRLGSYQRDEGLPVTGFEPPSIVLEDDYGALRREIWKVTDWAYRAAVAHQAYAKKEPGEPTRRAHDFSQESPIVDLSVAAAPALDPAPWADRLRRLSAIFRSHPRIAKSSLHLVAFSGRRYIVNSEGTRLRLPVSSAALDLEGTIFLPQGRAITRRFTIVAPSLSQMLPEAELERRVRGFAASLDRQASTPLVETYSGPVLLSPAVTALLVGPAVRDAVCANQAHGLLQPLFSTPVPQPVPGQVIFPPFISVADDPTRRDWCGQPLAGSYLYDEEGVPAQAVQVIAGGRLVTPLLSRRPMVGFPRSNGHGRGAFMPGANMSNLFIDGGRGRSWKQLKEQLRSLCRERGLPWGLAYVDTTVALRISASDGTETWVTTAAPAVGLADLRQVVCAGEDLCATPIGLDATVVSPGMLFGNLEVRPDAIPSVLRPILPHPGFPPSQPAVR